MEKCRFCDVPVYIKVQQLMRPVLAPITEEQAAWDNWVEKSGQNYAYLPIQYCPVCGRKKEA